MHKIYSVAVDHTRMLSLFAGSNLELPFRFQPNVVFKIPYNEYCEFCRTVINTGIYCLSFGKEIYAEAFSDTKPNKIKQLCLYYYDLSKIVLDEVMLSAAASEDGTRIIHDFSYNPSITDSMKFEDSFQMFGEFEDNRRKKVLDSIRKQMLPGVGYANLSDHNKYLLNYALYLRGLSYTSSPRIFNLS